MALVWIDQNSIQQHPQYNQSEKQVIKSGYLEKAQEISGLEIESSTCKTYP